MEIRVSFVIDGKKFDPSKDGEVLDLEKATLDLFRKTITDSIGSLRCADHDSPVEITCSGKSLNDLSLSVSACCKKFGKTVAAKLEKDLGS